MGQLQEVSKEIVELGYQILFISPDRPEKIREVTKKSGIEFTLLSDSDLQAATAMGISYKVSDETNKKLQKYGIDIEDASGQDHHLLPVPGVFILDKDQIVKFHYFDPDYRVRIHPELLLAAARAAR